VFISQKMEYNVEELKKVLIEQCKEEGIYYALIAIDKQTKEIVLPQSLDNALSNPDYCVFKCKKAEDGYEVEEVK
jgi:hypothetical protein